MNTDLVRVWNNLDRDDKLEIIENGIDMMNTSEGFLTLRLFKKGNDISSFITNKLDNHLCLEVVSQSTLIELFSDNHDFEEEDGDVILNWMESQK